MNIKERQKIVLAALLHDIGKFWERSDDYWNISTNIKMHFPNTEFGHVVPKYENGSPKYTHALWTHMFINEFKIGNHLGLDGEGDQTLANLSARHHLPDAQLNFMERVISIADRWSSSIDRPDEGEEDESPYDQVKKIWGSGFSKKVPLESIFDAISVKEKISENKHKIGLSKLNVLDNDEIIYPKKYQTDPSSSLQNEYTELWAQFIKEIEALKGRCTEFDSFYDSLNDILRNYLWCIPSATNTIPCNVSLYEHSKTTAGIALAIYDYCVTNHKEKIDKDDECLMMLCIDVAGIQKFIYDIANKKAAKSLKGRSFFLQLLMDNIIDRLLNHKDVMAYRTNVIYASGGKAYLILPNTDKTKEAIKAIDIETQEYLWKEHQGKLYAVFGYISFTYETFKNSESNNWDYRIQSKDISEDELKKINKDRDTSLDLGDIWRLVSDRAAQAKNRKFERKIIEEFDSFFKPRSFDHKEDKCNVSGERSKHLKDLNDGRDPENKVMVLSSIYDQSKLGEDLKDANFLVTYKDGKEGLHSNIHIYDSKYSVYDQENLKYLDKGTLYSKAYVSVLNRTDFKEKLNNVAIRTLFYGGNKQPLLENKKDVKTYEDLAKCGEQQTKLAILRMDVDGLGQIFINGFEERKNGQKKSFAAYATLSFILEAFFCGHINYIHQRSDRKYKDFVQILYSGGDDLFAVGRWDQIIDFAEEIRKEFRRFVGRDDITISGGIAIVGAKYPIMKSAELSGEMEKKAKEFNNKAKNAINFFGETVSWDKEFDFVKYLKIKLSNEKINSAFLHKMQEFKLLKDKYKYGKSETPAYKWNAAYYTSKILENTTDQEVKSIYKGIQIGIFTGIENIDAERYLDLLGIACRWAEYHNKINKQKK